MKNYCAILVAVVALFSLCQKALAHTLYQDPIKIQAYVTDPAAAIKKGMQQYDWLVESEDASGLIAKLVYKDYELRVAISYSATQIDVASLSEKRINCVVAKREKCEIEQAYIDRWRSNLRRGITKAIHDLAIADAYTKLAAQ
ncbi:hypothetical protein QWY82_07465 [Simiduia curdlanivorans]|uniref:Lipoprotein n=1 Tax=Simiduia curdlanivorans TaxID=1492769 RepID=A0ABV8V7V0_9GAMM|nr:hypothetical protein [Simiduia curdlanivorans]MDN3638640.1 hypothetical protein [Simiduia curdlanivorans]